jgi:hypothetical protein
MVTKGVCEKEGVCPFFLTNGHNQGEVLLAHLQ